MLMMRQEKKEDKFIPNEDDDLLKINRMIEIIDPESKTLKKTKELLKQVQNTKINKK